MLYDNCRCVIRPGIDFLSPLTGAHLCVTQPANFPCYSHILCYCSRTKCGNNKGNSHLCLATSCLWCILTSAACIYMSDRSECLYVILAIVRQMSSWRMEEKMILCHTFVICRDLHSTGFILEPAQSLTC